MKKLLLSLTVLISMVVGANAQEVGQMWAGGSVGFNTSKTDGFDRHTNYRIIPEFGYVVSSDWGIGVKLGYGHSELSTTTSSKEKVDEFTINPFARYSFLKGDIGGLFVDSGVGYTHGKVKNGAKSDALEIGFKPGVAIALSERLALTGRYGFLGYKYNKKGELKTNEFGFDFDLSSVELGLNIVF